MATTHLPLKIDKSNLNAKEKLRNTIIDDMAAKNVGFSAHGVATTGTQLVNKTP